MPYWDHKRAARKLSRPFFVCLSAGRLLSNIRIRTMKKLLAPFGLISLGLGIVGIFVPVLPTTPFLLLASWLFLKSSKRLYDWLMNHPRLGPYIKDFMLDKAIPLKVKIIAISTLWASLVCCAIFIAKHLALRIIFILIAVGVTIHILT